MKKKLLIPVLCIMMMVIGGFATWAYLTSQDSVVNTFTVGDVTITMDEADTDNSTAGDNDRDKANAYHLIPGTSYSKDPMIHVAADDPATAANEASENCYLFVKVDNQIANIELKGDVKNPTIAEQMYANGWYVLVEDTANPANTVYYYKNIAKAGQDIPVFTNFKIDGAVANAELAGYVDANVIVNAYAVQSQGFNTATEIGGNISVKMNEALAAWTSANGQFK